jgi:hypothetical protein
MNVVRSIAHNVLRTSCIQTSAGTTAEPQPSKPRCQTRCSDSESPVRAQDLSANPACPRRPQRPTVAYMPPPGDCRATNLRPTPGNTGSSIDRVSTHAIRHADDWLGPIHDLQAHGPTTVPLPGSPRCARCGLAPQRTGSVESVTASDIALKRTGSLSEYVGFEATQAPT